ncbi:hypothetical protein BN946_scf185007.g262 [Trametes cinnabarina]|uniref:Uncharacterized protein n=1 Tax=Pycnoporus cinnabarinus TaxID=5643 RepID=A0A060SFB8_PYCCI|nr:hypothetical protein BN946_scf185007.g262 [Trametes cinnabarina]
MAKTKNPILSEHFKNPDHFVPVKGRGGRVYCRICTPPDRSQGQPMTINAAIRHERENVKHDFKIREAALWDWGQQAEPDWVTPAVPQGESAWEHDPCTSERIKAYIQFWLEGIAADERGKPVPKMDVFISRFDKAYEEENWGLKFEEWDDEEYEEEWAVEERDGIPGYWYAGGSFDPLDDGFDRPAWMQPYVPSHSPESIARRAIEEKWWPDDPDPREGWGSVVDEPMPWSTAPHASGGVQYSQPSDATPQQTSEKAASQQKRRRRYRRRGGRGRGHGEQQKGSPGNREKQAHVPNSSTRRIEAHRDRRAKAY